MQSLLEKVQDLMSVSCGAGSVPDSIVGRKVGVNKFNEEHEMIFNTSF